MQPKELNLFIITGYAPIPCSDSFTAFIAHNLVLFCYAHLTKIDVFSRSYKFNILLSWETQCHYT